MNIADSTAEVRKTNRRLGISTVLVDFPLRYVSLSSTGWRKNNKIQRGGIELKQSEDPL